MELSINQLENLKKEKSVILDVRQPEKFASACIPGSYNVYMDSNFGRNASFFIQKDQAIVMVDEEKNGDSHLSSLTKKGYKNLQGYLQGGFDIWAEFGKETDLVISISPYEFSLELKHSKMKFLDIRDIEAYNKKRVLNSIHVNLSDILFEHVEINKEQMYCIFCEDGILSMSLISYLKTKGFHNIYHLSGGFQSALNEKGIEIVK